MSECRIRPTATRDLTGAQPDLASSQVLDLESCHRFEAVITLFEHESAGLRIETWPDPVRLLMEKMVADWQGKHPERVLRAVTTALANRACIMVVHHAAKG